MIIHRLDILDRGKEIFLRNEKIHISINSLIRCIYLFLIVSGFFDRSYLRDHHFRRCRKLGKSGTFSVRKNGGLKMKEKQNYEREVRQHTPRSSINNSRKNQLEPTTT